MIWVEMQQRRFLLTAMQKNRFQLKVIRYPFVYVIAAALMGVAGFMNFEWIQVDLKKIIQSTVFLGGLYLLFYFVFLFLQKKHRDQSAFIFLIILMLKFGLILGFLFLFLNPSDAENKREILLFLMTYFVLLVVDIAIKIRLMK